MKRNVFSLTIAMLFVAGLAIAQDTPQPADAVVEAPAAPEVVETSNVAPVASSTSDCVGCGQAVVSNGCGSVVSGCSSCGTAVSGCDACASSNACCPQRRVRTFRRNRCCNTSCCATPAPCTTCAAPACNSCNSTCGTCCNNRRFNVVARFRPAASSCGTTCCNSAPATTCCNSAPATTCCNTVAAAPIVETAPVGTTCCGSTGTSVISDATYTCAPAATNCCNTRRVRIFRRWR